LSAGDDFAPEAIEQVIDASRAKTVDWLTN